MDEQSSTIDRWRKFFRTSDGDIFDVLEAAIVVAASDCPGEFRMRRGEIAEKLFACRLLRSSDCAIDCGDGSPESLPKGRKIVSSSDDETDERNMNSNYSYDEAEALTMEIEKSSQIVDEVLRIKSIFEDPDKSDSSLFDSLQKLQLMELSFDILQATEIGRAVSRLKKHRNNQIRSLGKLLISGWKNMVDEWVQTTDTLCNAGDSPDSVNPPLLGEEEGLPSPPLDEGAFLTPETTFEFAKFFDGVDDDEKPRIGGGHGKNREREMNSNAGKDERKKRTHIIEEDERRGMMMRKEELIVNNKQTKVTTNQAPNTIFGPGKPQELVGREESAAVGKKQTRGAHFHIPSNSMNPARPPIKPINKEPVTKPKLQKKLGFMQKTSAIPQDKAKSSDEMMVKVKLEAAKRKLHEGYQQAENAKKQRTIQVMELHDLPKQGLPRRNPQLKPGTHSRQWNNRRR